MRKNNTRDQLFDDMIIFGYYVIDAKTGERVDPVEYERMVFDLHKDDAKEA
jgi:hypothetical protein